MNNHQQDQRKKYDMQQAHIMRGGGAGTFLSMNDNHNHTTKKTVPSSSSSLSKDEKEKEVFKALKDLDRAEMMASRRHGEDEMIAIHQHQHQHQHQLEHARDLYRQAIGRLLEYVNYVSRNSTSNNNSSNRQYNHHGNGTSDQHQHHHHHDLIQIDVLKERIKLALTHAEEIQETLLQQQQQQQQRRPIISQARGKEEPKRRQFILGRSKSENINGSKKTSSGKTAQSGMDGTTLASSASADDDAAYRKSKNQSQSRSRTTKRSNLNYSTNDPFIQIIKKDMYIDSKTIHTTWNDISGLKSAKQALQEAAILPLLRPDLYTGLRSAPRGILLYGPPGTGKTMLVRAVAHESQCILFACSASSMTSKWVGEAEKLVRTLFRMAADVAPSIIFLDELDALLGRRKSDGNSEQESSRRFKTEFMIQMDGLAAGGGGSGGDGGDGSHPPTLLIGCTNCPWDVDDAVMRRFQRRIYVPLPDKASRKTLWEKLIDKSKGSVRINSSRDLGRLVDLSEGFSCSDISSIANEAAFGPLRDLGSIEVIKDISVQDVRPIQMKDFEGVIRNAKKSVSVELLKKYDEWESAQAAATAAAKG